MTKEQKQIAAQKAVINRLQETIAAQERTILAKTHAVQALTTLKEVLSEGGKLNDLLPREPLLWFAQEMEKKLRANDHKDGWHDCKIGWLFERLLEEVEELHKVVQVRKGAHIIEEAADVANFCMMLADKVRE